MVLNMQKKITGSDKISIYFFITPQTLYLTKQDVE